ncbi:BTAD domain-containing putative transcriptional regulator [Leifsonia sp. Root112D2]|uniref:BTAD domain-containing putative transcriptional regulator n=1 Tax=Leifsonia sp. Root112D2 TaxID=1736426 RepID=UPI000A7157ED|nr:BTAD domain-containing putative transcriptional regulator [Leifsonia sp. Root112D2]
MPSSPTIADIRVAVLGPVRVAGPGLAAGATTLVEPAGARGKALIVALAASPGVSVSVAQLIDELWQDEPPKGARAALQTLVSRLRQASAEGLIESGPSGYALNLSPRQTDAGLASALLAEARDAHRRGDTDEAVRLTSDALALWRGEPGADLGATELASELQARAAALRGELLRLRASARLGEGDNAGALTDLDAASAASEATAVSGATVPSAFDEELVTLRMRALAAAGRRNDAVRVFGDFRALLRDELGTDPSPALVSLNAELLREETATRPAAIRIGLRTAPNELLGREHDIEALKALLRTARLTTILGPGGLGKTRLAQELARTAAEHTPAVIVVELASVRTGEDVTLALASTLGIREASTGRLKLNDPGVRLDVHERILATLGERETLLVIDNCEHIVDAAASWIADILASTTTVRVLATSRAPLAISAEQVYPLDSLASNPGEDAAPAVTLFVERARAARPGVNLPLEAIARLCTRLDGLPLAIELAAARVRSMPVEEIERRLNNRFALLTGGERTAPERHRTLTAVIDWSWNLLGASEQRLLRRLSSFPDGFGADAAQLVGEDDDAHDVTNDLDGLVNQSLVAVSEDDATGLMRYRMLETVREFGSMALVDAGEDARIQRAMFRWAEQFAISTIAELDSDAQIRAFALVTAEQDNLIAVLREAIDAGAADTTVTLFSLLGYYWSMRGAHSDVAAFGASVVTVTRHYTPDEAHRDAAIMSYSLAGTMAFFGDPRTSLLAIGRLRAMKRLGAAHDPRLEAMSELLLTATTQFDSFRGELKRYTRSDDPGVAGLASLLSAQMYENDGELAQSLASSTRAYELAQGRGNVWSEATAAQSLAELHSQRGRPREALMWAERSRQGLNALQAHGDLQQLNWMIGLNEVSMGDAEGARATFEHFVDDDDATLGDDFHDLRSIGYSGLAEIAFHDGRSPDAVSLYLQAVDSFGTSHRSPWLTIVTSAALAAQVRADVREYARADAIAAKLRTRLLVTRRLQVDNSDMPVAGSGLVALAAWLAWPGRAGASAAVTEIALRMLFLGDRMGSRQDLPTLNITRLTDAAVAAHGSAAVDAARLHAEALTPREAMTQGFELLRNRALLARFAIAPVE